ncbi:MAG: hypothetical protein HQL77_17640 [Magnetococcales bacterium]|nr:hypothetical protein [Magnetococcales bacterium]
MKRYKDLCEAKGWLSGSGLPTVTDIQSSRALNIDRNAVQATSSVLPYQGHAEELLKDPSMSVTVILQRLRERGTTGWRPIDRFENVEENTLLPLPRERWESSIWKEAKLHPDCHVQVEKSFYSAPFRLIGQKLTVQIAGSKVRIFNDLELVATHDRSWLSRSRQTNEDHLPTNKVQWWMATPQGCLKQAEKIGPFALKWMQCLLENQVTDRLRSGLAALRLADKYSPKRFEVACERSLDFEEIQYSTLKRILINDLDMKPWKHLLPPPILEPVMPSRYARHPGYYFDRSQEVH